MDNQKIQEHVQTVKEAIEKASTQHEWDTDGRFIEWKDGNPLNGTHRRIAITQALTSEVFDNPNHANDAYLISNSPTWHQQSIEIIEQQKREIERLRESLNRIASYCHLGESFHTSMTRCIKIAVTALEEAPTDVNG